MHCLALLIDFFHYVNFPFQIYGPLIVFLMLNLCNFHSCKPQPSNCLGYLHEIL